MRVVLVVVSLVLLLLAGLSAILSGVNLSEVGLIAFGLAAYVGSKLVPPNAV